MIIYNRDLQRENYGVAFFVSKGDRYIMKHGVFHPSIHFTNSRIQVTMTAAWKWNAEIARLSQQF